MARTKYITPIQRDRERYNYSLWKIVRIYIKRSLNQGFALYYVDRIRPIDVEKEFYCKASHLVEVFGKENVKTYIGPLELRDGRDDLICTGPIAERLYQRWQDYGGFPYFKIANLPDLPSSQRPTVIKDGRLIADNTPRFDVMVHTKDGFKLASKVMDGHRYKLD